MRTHPRGSSTIELMVALLILASMLSTAAMVSFSNQSVIQDADVFQTGLYQTSHALEHARVELSSDLEAWLVPPAGTTGVTYGVTRISDCAAEVRATKNWVADNRAQSVAAATLVTSPAAMVAHGGNCSIVPPSGNGWDCPLTGSSANVSPDVDPTALEVVNVPGAGGQRVAYVTSVKKNREVFLMYDVTNADNGTPLSPIVLPIVGPNNDTAGFYDLEVVWKPDGSAGYAYVVGRDDTKHLQVIDVKSTSATYNTVIPGGTYALPGSNQNALSVAYHHRLVSGVPRDVLYIGTKANGSGPELFMVDVTTPSAPSPLGVAVEIGADVNAIAVTTDNYAYLATSSAAAELIALNVADLSAPVRADVNIAPDKASKSLWLAGDRLYVGSEDEAASDTNPDFRIYNIATRMAPAYLTGVNTNGTVGGNIVAGNLAFLATDESNKEMKIRRGLTSDAICFFSDSQLSNKGVALDYEGDRAYVLSSGGSADFQVYRPNPGPCATPPPACP